MNDIRVLQNKIYVIRGQRVMLDYDLAAAYGVKTAQLKRQVRRNIERFEGDDFMFEVTNDELSRCQIGTLNTKQGQNIKYLPFAFTELGVAMLSSVLRSTSAIKVNRDIMRAFVFTPTFPASETLCGWAFQKSYGICCPIFQMSKDLRILGILHNLHDNNTNTDNTDHADIFLDSSVP